MTGVSDLPFRRTAARLGAAYVATEMVASAEFARGRPDVVRRAAVGEGLPLTVIQLVGREPRWMAEGARLAKAAGADIIDLNFGCPAKEVTGVLSGSALMRDLDLAQSLVAAATGAYVLWAGTSLIRGSVGGLMDMAPDAAVLDRINDLISESGTGVIEVHDLRARNAGRLTFLDFHLVVPGAMTVSESHAICDRIEAALNTDMSHLAITIHVEPEEKAKLRAVGSSKPRIVRAAPG